MMIRVFNYNTLEKVHGFEAHSDYLRCLQVHPTQPYLLSSSGKQKSFSCSKKVPMCPLNLSYELKSVVGRSFVLCFHNTVNNVSHFRLCGPCKIIDIYFDIDDIF